MLLGNPQHPDFGVYAAFVTGMGKTVELPNPPVYVCGVCYRPLFVLYGLPKKKNTPEIDMCPFEAICQYCRGVQDGKKQANPVKQVVEKLREPNGIEELVTHHQHEFTNRKNHPCKICGVYKNFLAIADSTRSTTNATEPPSPKGEPSSPLRE